jgi:hypothetical protein
LYSHSLDWTGNDFILVIQPPRGPHRKLRHYCWNVFTESLHSNCRRADNSEPIVACVTQQQAVNTRASIVECLFLDFCGLTVLALGQYATTFPDSCQINDKKTKKFKTVLKIRPESYAIRQDNWTWSV